MKRSFLSRLQLSGWYYLAGALLILLGVPLYQFLVLTPAQYDAVLSAQSSNHFAIYLAWINTHPLQYIIYRILLITAFALLITLPFNLFRIVVAQEIVDQQERAEEELDRDDYDDEDEAATDEDETDTNEHGAEDGMPPYAWRGKGFAVIAAWAGLIGLLAYVLGAISGTIYVLAASKGATGASIPGNFVTLYTLFSLTSNAAGIGLVALSTLFFGALIARRGRNLWPTVWLLFGYMALAVAALLSGSAVATAGAPSAQAALTTPAFLLFALWVLWYSIMLIRLKPE